MRKFCFRCKKEVLEGYYVVSEQTISDYKINELSSGDNFFCSEGCVRNWILDRGNDSLESWIKNNVEESI